MTTRDVIPVVLLCELAFLLACAPYLLGIYSYAPKDHLATSFMGQVYPEEAAQLTQRDSAAQGDFPNQERHFLRFYRDQILDGNLPFWNERSFGGISQEDALLYSYLSPLNLVWLLTEKDHLAKGLQMFLLMNMSLVGILWWCGLLSIPVHWVGVGVAFITLSPMAMHFQGHTHQPGLYAMGMMISACFVQFMQKGGVRLLLLLFGLMCLSIAINFLSLLFFVGVFLVLFGIPFIWEAMRERVVLVRLAVSVAVCLLSFVTLSFFLGPILLESTQVWGPVEPQYTIWSSLLNPVRAVWNMWVGYKSPEVAYWFLVPIGAVVLLYKKNRQIHSRPFVGAMLVWVLCSLLASSATVQELARTYVPGLKNTGNIYMRQMFMGNQYTVLLLLAVLHQLRGYRKSIGGRILELGLVGVIAANLVFLSMALWPSAWGSFGAAIQINTLNEWIGVANDHPERLYNLVLSVCLALVVYALWLLDSGEARRKVRFALGFAAMLLCVGMFQFASPNLPMSMDDTKNPLWAIPGIEPGGTTVSLRQCGGGRRVGGGASAYADMRPIDGPGDTGLFRGYREFWHPYNNQRQEFAEGRKYYDLTWVCEEVVTDADGRLFPEFLALLRMVGVNVLFSATHVHGDGVSFLGQAGSVRAYGIQGAWKDVVAIPDLSQDDYLALVRALRNREPAALNAFQRVESDRVEVRYKRLSSLVWEVDLPPETPAQGLLFMNHPVEYNLKKSFPFTDIPMEGKWQLCDDVGCTDFPLTDVPYRFLPIPSASKVIIRYSLQHYMGWGVVSGVGLLAVFCVLLFYRRGCKRT